jgi:hypothetical protein
MDLELIFIDYPAQSAMQSKQQELRNGVNSFVR